MAISILDPLEINTLFDITDALFEFLRATIVNESPQRLVTWYLASSWLTELIAADSVSFSRYCFIWGWHGLSSSGYCFIQVDNSDSFSR